MAVLRFFPSLVTGPALTVVGLSLLGVTGGIIFGKVYTATDFASTTNIGPVALIILSAVAVPCLGRGLWRQLGVVIALSVGVVISLPMGLDDLSAATDDWFGIPTPFHFSAPEFPITAVVTMSIVMIVIFAESTASILPLGEITGKPVNRGDLARGPTADRISGIAGAVFNDFITTVYANNVGVVSTTWTRFRSCPAAISH